MLPALQTSLKKQRTLKPILTLTILGVFIVGTALYVKGTQTDSRNEAQARLITHAEKGRAQLSPVEIKAVEDRLHTNESSLTLPLDEMLNLLHQMTEFELGRFLLKNGGISGYWTAYWLIHGPAKKLDHPLEDWLINKAPAFMASRERYKIFATQIQKRLKPAMKLASIPCGLMDDLLHLDYSQAPGARIYGFDLDEESIDLGQQNAKVYGKESMALFDKRDAWHLQEDNTFDLITSNGLNFYEHDDARVLELYKEFHRALRPGGVLVTSFLTPPPMMVKDSTWKNFNPDDMKRQKAIFSDIMNARWHAFRTEALTRSQLEQAGFKVVEFIYDSQGIFPTVIAEKVE